MLSFTLDQLFGLCISAAVLMALKVEVVSCVRVEEARKHAKAVASILDRLRDAMVHLDANLKTAAPSLPPC